MRLIDSNSFSPDRIHGSVNDRNRRNVQEWSTHCLLEGNIGRARTGFRALADNREPDEHRGALELERDAYLDNGYLREALYTHAMFKAIMGKHGLSFLEIYDDQFIRCGDVCLERGDLQNAIDAYAKGNHLVKLRELTDKLVQTGQKELAEKAAAAIEHILD